MTNIMCLFEYQLHGNYNCTLKFMLCTKMYAQTKSIIIEDI